MSSSSSLKNSSNSGNGNSNKNGSSSSSSHRHHHHHHGSSHGSKQSKTSSVDGVTYNNSSSSGSQSTGIKMKIKRKDGTRTSHDNHEVIMTAGQNGCDNNTAIGKVPTAISKSTPSPTKASSTDKDHSSPLSNKHSMPVKLSVSSSHKKKDKSLIIDSSASSSSTIIIGSNHSQTLSSPEKSPLKDGHTRISNRSQQKNPDMVRLNLCLI